MDRETGCGNGSETNSWVHSVTVSRVHGEQMTRSGTVLTRLLLGLGWIVAAGSLHLAFEVFRAVVQKPGEALGGYASLSRLTSITGWCFWLALPWLVVASIAWFRGSKAHPGSTWRRTGAGLILFVAVAFLLATGALILARTENIAVFY